MQSLRFPGKSALSSTGCASLLACLAMPVYAQSANPTVTISPATPVSTEPFVATIASTVPDGTGYFITIDFGLPPHGQVASCQAVQKNGSAACQLGRLAPGYYIAQVAGGGNLVQPLNFTVAAPGASTVSALQGQYAFLLTDQSGTKTSLPNGAAAAGSFTADGRGKITGGIMDLNSPGTSFQGLPITGTYTLDATGQGTLTLVSPQGTASLAISTPTAQTLSNVISSTLVALPGSLITGGGTLVSQSGLLQSTTPVNPGFASALAGGYQATLAGALGSPSVPLGGAMQFAFDAAGTLTSAGQLVVGGGPVSFSGLAGTYRPVNGTTGRTTFTLGAPGQPTFSFAAYETSEQSFYFLSLASRAANPLLAGTATQ